MYTYEVWSTDAHSYLKSYTLRKDYTTDTFSDWLTKWTNEGISFAWVRPPFSEYSMKQWASKDSQLQKDVQWLFSLTKPTLNVNSAAIIDWPFTYSTVNGNVITEYNFGDVLDRTDFPSYDFYFWSVREPGHEIDNLPYSLTTGGENKVYQETVMTIYLKASYQRTRGTDGVEYPYYYYAKYSASEQKLYYSRFTPNLGYVYNKKEKIDTVRYDSSESQMMVQGWGNSVPTIGSETLGYQFGDRIYVRIS